MANPWVHCKINNATSYDLVLVGKELGGTRNFRWNKLPPDKIPAKTAMNDVYDATANDLLWGNVQTSVTYEADIGGFSVRIDFHATANDHPAGGWGGTFNPTSTVPKKNKR